MFVYVFAQKEIYNLSGESLGCFTVHLRRVNVTKVYEQINPHCAQRFCDDLIQIVE